MHTGAVLKSPETRKACTILENIEARLSGVGHATGAGH
jgi:hypothetical protein